MHQIIVIEKDKKWGHFLFDTLSPLAKVDIWTGDRDIYGVLDAKRYDIAVLDRTMEPNGSYDLLQWMRSTFPDTSVVITSSQEPAEMVVNGIKHGACDFLTKPFSRERARHAICRILRERSLKNEIDYLRREQDIIYEFGQIIAFSSSMKKVISALGKFSQTDSTLLVTGETGTGKSFLSGSIHFNSHRKNKPFIKVNCANIPETLLESELFGHEKGAFTGATKQRIGRFEQADGGTLFLDEIGELSLPLQAKMLRVLEEKAFERIGGNRTIASDVRIIAATNRDLEKLTLGKKFRRDLYYRINVLSIRLPPLRERRQCIEPLAHALLIAISRSLKKTVSGFCPEVIDWFKKYQWPGNIRQLSNTIERAVILEEGPRISADSVSMIDPSMASAVRRDEKAPSDQAKSLPSTLSLKDMEKRMILKALNESLWIQKDAAELLGVSPRALIYKIQKFGITHPRWRKNT